MMDRLHLPTLYAELGGIPGGKHWLTIIEGAEGCCPTFSRATPRQVTIPAGLTR